MHLRLETSGAYLKEGKATARWVARSARESWRDFGARIGAEMNSGKRGIRQVPIFLGTGLVLAVPLSVASAPRRGRQWLRFAVEEFTPWDAENISAAAIGTGDTLLALACDTRPIGEFASGLRLAGIESGPCLPATLAAAQMAAFAVQSEEFDCRLIFQEGQEWVRVFRGRPVFWWGPAASESELRQRLKDADLTEHKSVVWVGAAADGSPADSNPMLEYGHLLDSFTQRLRQWRFRPWAVLDVPGQTTKRESAGVLFLSLCWALTIGAILFSVAFLARGYLVRREADELGRRSGELARQVLETDRVHSPLRSLRSEWDEASRLNRTVHSTGSNADLVVALRDLLALAPTAGPLEVSHVAIVGGRISLRAKAPATETLDNLTRIFQTAGYAVDQITYGAEFEVAFIKRPAGRAADPGEDCP